MPKILLTNDHDLLISNEELAKFDIHRFEVSPWALVDADTQHISGVDNIEEANGIGVYARLVGGLSMCVKDFNIGANMTAEEAQEDAVRLAETLNAYLPGNEPVLDDHLEAAYEDRVSGMDFGWEY